jgi:lipopolysaccharide export system permease protein
MSKIINRYIFKEMAVPFVIVITVLTITSLLSKVIIAVNLLVNYGVGFFILLKFFLFSMPWFLIYIIPMSFLIAVLITYNRLSSDNEITAMKASGLDLLRISMPVAVMALIAYFIATFFTVYAFAWGNVSSKRLIYEVARSKATIGLKERVFNDAFDGLILYANNIIAENGEMEGIFISDQRDEQDKFIVVAKSGIISSDQQAEKITLRLLNGTIHKSEESGLYKVITFNTYNLNLRMKQGEVKNPDTSKTNSDLTVGQLKEKIADMKRQGSAIPPSYIIDLHQRFALPASIFVFSFLGVPLGIQRVRTTRFTSFSVGLGVVLFYYVLSTALESFGKKGLINPIAAAWGANIFMAIAGVTIFYKAAKDSPIKSLAWLEGKKDAVFAVIRSILSWR